MKNKFYSVFSCLFIAVVSVLCIAIQNVFANVYLVSKSSGSAKVGWSSNEIYDKWEVCYKKKGIGKYTRKTIKNSNRHHGGDFIFTTDKAKKEKKRKSYKVLVYGKYDGQNGKHKIGDLIFKAAK